MISTIKAFADICKKEPIALGRQMENNYRQIIFDCSGFSEPITDITLVHQRSQDTAPYVVASTTESPLVWTINNTDTAYYGYGKGELRITFASGLAKSASFQTVVIKSITAGTEIPDPLQSWYDAMIDYINEHSVTDDQLAQAISDYIEAHPITAPVQSVNSMTGDVVLTASDVGAYAKPSGGIPKTDLTASVQTSLNKADTALQSAPVTSVNSKTGAVSLNASDVGALPSTYTAPVTSVDGKTGDVQIMPSGGTAGQVLTKTASGTAWQTPQAGGSVDSVNGQTGTVVLDADDVGALPDTTTAADLGAYVKPSTGIPKTDLDSAVQTSLGKADTALQTAPVTSVNGQTGAVTLSIPTKTSDLTNDSGYITSAPVQSVDGKTGAVTVIPTGGSTGQVLAKASATDRDVEWITPSGGGGNDWQLLHDSTTTEDALLQIALTNISVKEVRIYAIEPAGYTSSVVVYCPLNNSAGNHYDKNYGRPMLSLSNSGSTQKIIMAAQEPIIMNGLIENPTYANNSGGQSNIQLKSAIGTNVTAGMTFTSMSIATYQSVPAGLRIVAFGR